MALDAEFIVVPEPAVEEVVPEAAVETVVVPEPVAVAVEAPPAPAPAPTPSTGDNTKEETTVRQRCLTVNR